MFAVSRIGGSKADARPWALVVSYGAGVAVILALLAGCTQRARVSDHKTEACNAAPASTQPTPAEVPPATSVPADPAEVPIVYRMRFKDHPPLTDEQVRDILLRAARVCPRGQHMWFIYVTANWVDADGLRASAAVYFTPDAVGDRLQTGRYMPFSQPSAAMVELQKKVAGTDSPPVTAPRLREYCYVPLPDAAPGIPPAAPNPASLPFPKPDGFSESELLALIDFVRTDPAPKPAAPGTYPPPRAFHGAVPIVGISRDKDIIEVQNGSVQGLLCGTGQVLRCRRNSDGTFEVVDIGEWIS